MGSRQTPLADADLVAAVRRGDGAAADALVRRHFRTAFAVAFAQLGNAMDAEDVCQDAFVRALERIGDCRQPERFVHWLLSVVRNHAHNARERRRVRSGPSLDEIEARAFDDPSRDAARSRLRADLEQALVELSPAQREVLLLKHLDGWDHGEIAVELGISEVMSRQHAFTARRLLREWLGPEKSKEYFGE